MSENEKTVSHRLQTFLRFYVATTPQTAEEGWQVTQRFERLPYAEKQPGHWYRFEGSNDLIEVDEDRSGEWHRDGVLPEGIDPGLVVNVPMGERAQTVLSHMTAILSEVPETSPTHGEITELLATLNDLGTPERAARLAKNFQQVLGTVPAVAGEQMRFLRQAAQQTVGKELLAGRARGYDAAGLLMVSAIVEAVGKDDPERCLKLGAKALTWELVAIDEMASKLIEECWYLKLGAKLTEAFDSLRSEGETVIETARLGAYPEGHPELALEIYYGSLLQAVPYLLGAHTGFYKLSKAPASPEDRELFAHKANTAEEKLVRMTTALLYAVNDIDLSQLADKRARVAAVLKQGDKERAEALIHEIIDLEFFYPPRFRSVLLGSD